MEQQNNRSPYNFARDGFLYLLSYFTLGVWVLDYNFLVKALVNHVIPDSVNPSSWSITPEFILWLIPPVLIAFPLFVGINVYANKLLGRGEMRHDTGVRRWLIYLTMVVVIMTILGELIALLMSYLNGEAGLRFFIHTMITLIIAAGVLWYQWWQLRFFKGEEQNKLDSKFKIFEWTSFVLVTAAIVLGFVVVGTPGMRRAAKLDDMRIQRIAQVRSAVNSFYGQPATANNDGFGNLRLPKTLEELRKDSRVYLSETDTQDPVTNKPLEYKVLSAKQFEVCDDFATELKKVDSNNYYSYGKPEEYLHPKGHHCFDFTVTAGQ